MARRCTTCHVVFGDDATRCPRCGADASGAVDVVPGAEADYPRPGYGEPGLDPELAEARFRYGALLPFVGIGAFTAIGAVIGGENGAFFGAVIGLVVFAVIAPLTSR